MNAVRLEYDDVKNAFSRVLKALRTVAGASEQEFAACLGMETHDYIAYEGGKWGASLFSVLDIARRLSVPPETLLSATESFMSRSERPAPGSLAQCHLYRLGWVDAQGVVHESGHAAYDSIDQACADLTAQNALRKAQGARIAAPHPH